MSINYVQALKKYLNQTVVWEKCTGHDEYGKAEYAEGVEIQVRKIPQQKLVEDRYGKQSISKTTVLTTDEIGMEDMIDGQPIIAIEWSVDRWGKNIAKQAFL
ncbi:MAG: hypothetical protein AB1Z23_03405 [Eubacteriales bacterium]